MTNPEVDQSYSCYESYVAAPSNLLAADLSSQTCNCDVYGTPWEKANLCSGFLDLRLVRGLHDDKGLPNQIGRSAFSSNIIPTIAPPVKVENPWHEHEHVHVHICIHGSSWGNRGAKTGHKQLGSTSRESGTAETGIRIRDV